jgi:hypothetical protein
VEVRTRFRVPFAPLLRRAVLRLIHHYHGHGRTPHEREERGNG